jgi:hypothetical protein
MPLPAVNQAAQAIARGAAGAYLSAQRARPLGAFSDGRALGVRRGSAAWIRRGDVFAVHAAGNHPGVHALWLEAVALGYRVAVRPSRREPLTPYRLVSALRASGFGEDQVVLLPTEYDAADEILRQADLGMVYGGQDVTDKYAAGTKAHLGGDGVVEELGDGSAVLRPAVHQLDDPFAEQANIEFAFPCVWVAPWTREAGIAALRDTLVLTAVTEDERLLDDLLAEPTIKNLYIGDHPTYWMAPGVPHDAYLGEFLMRTKGVIRS